MRAQSLAVGAGEFGSAAAGEVVFPAGGGDHGALIGGRLGAWGGRATGEWLNDLIFATSISNPFRGKPGSEVTCLNRNAGRDKRVSTVPTAAQRRILIGITVTKVLESPIA